MPSRFLCGKRLTCPFLAISHGTIAAEYRDEVASKMTPAQIAEAQKLAREWKPKPERYFCGQLERPRGPSLRPDNLGSLAMVAAIRRFHWSSCFGHVSSNCRAPPLPQGGILPTTLSPVPSFGRRILVS
jgi:hypothetical protein